MPMFWVGGGRGIYAYVLGGERESHICLCFGWGKGEPYVLGGGGRAIYAYGLGGGRERHICLCFVVSVRVRVLVNF